MKARRCSCLRPDKAANSEAPPPPPCPWPQQSVFKLITDTLLLSDSLPPPPPPSLYLSPPALSCLYLSTLVCLSLSCLSHTFTPLFSLCLFRCPGTGGVCRLLTTSGCPGQGTATPLRRPPSPPRPRRRRCACSGPSRSSSRRSERTPAFCTRPSGPSLASRWGVCIRCLRGLRAEKVEVVCPWYCFCRG